MFAIAEVASRQYKLSIGDTVEIPHLPNKKEIALDKILLTVSGQEVNIGTPYLKGAKVICDIIDDAKSRKRIAFKFKKKKGYHRKIGHRALLTRIRVKEIKTG